MRREYLIRIDFKEKGSEFYYKGNLFRLAEDFDYTYISFLSHSKPPYKEFDHDAVNAAFDHMKGTNWSNVKDITW